jgi:hypothetical protein
MSLAIRKCRKKPRSNAAFSAASTWRSGPFGPRFLVADPLNSPRSRSRRQRLRYDEYIPSRRMIAPISPRSVHASTSAKICAFSSALNRRRAGAGLTSGSRWLLPLFPTAVMVRNSSALDSTLNYCAELSSIRFDIHSQSHN